MKSKVRSSKTLVYNAKSLENEVRKGWDEQFEKAIVNGELPDRNEFGNIKNIFDEREW